MNNPNLKIAAAVLLLIVCVIWAMVKVISANSIPAPNPVPPLAAVPPGSPASVAQDFFTDLSLSQAGAAAALVYGNSTTDPDTDPSQSPAKALKSYLGLQIVSVGVATADPNDPGGTRLVPYSVRLKDGTLKTDTMQLMFDTRVHRWAITGGY